MSDRELALELTKLYADKNNIRYTDDYYRHYIKMLENIKDYKSPSTLGKIEELINEFDKQYSYCEYDLHRLIDNIRNLLKGDSNE